MYVRRYTGADFQTVFRLDQLCFPPQFRFSRATMRQVVRPPGSLTLLACEPGQDGEEEVLGFCAWSLRRADNVHYAYLATLDVAPSRQRRGIGRTLLQEGERELARRQCEVAWLHVHERNHPAISLYTALGYRQVRLEPDFYGAGTGAWIYMKHLPPAARDPEAAVNELDPQ